MIDDNHKSTERSAIRALGELSLLLDSDPDLLDSMSSEDLRLDLRAMGLDPDVPVIDEGTPSIQHAEPRLSDRLLASQRPSQEESTVFVLPRNAKRKMPDERMGLRGGIFQRFLWFCSGANVSILSRPECAIDQGRYFAIGAGVLLISIFSALSSGYALLSLFSSIVISCVFGALWGLTIFFLNRLVSIPRRDDKSLGTVLLMVLPRLVIAAVVAFLIAEPLQLKLFQKEVEHEMARESVMQSRELGDQAKQFFLEIEHLEDQNQSLMYELKKKEARRSELYNTFLDEASGYGGTRKPGIGPVYLAKKEELERANRELEEQRATTGRLIQNNEERVARLKEQQPTVLAKVEQTNGLLAQLTAFQALTSQNRTLATFSWGIILLFMMLATLPMLVILLSARGPYDLILKRVEREVMVREERSILTLEMQTLLESEVNTAIRKLIIEAKFKADEDIELAAAEADFAPRLASEMNRRLRERLKSLADIFPSEAGSIVTETFR
jgi:hypothetical protein